VKNVSVHVIMSRLYYKQSLSPGNTLVAQPIPQELTPTSTSSAAVEPGMVDGPPFRC
jgi:hypothetical protein